MREGCVIDRTGGENLYYMLAEIREIRLSERRFYQKITDIYATARDDPKASPLTRQFFTKVQNKLHFAIHGYIAAEFIVERADAEIEHVGLTIWENSPDGCML